jgi:hypothetical protein
MYRILLLLMITTHSYSMDDKLEFSDIMTAFTQSRSTTNGTILAEDYVVYGDNINYPRGQTTRREFEEWEAEEKEAAEYCAKHKTLIVGCGHLSPTTAFDTLKTALEQQGFHGHAIYPGLHSHTNCITIDTMEYMNPDIVGSIKDPNIIEDHDLIEKFENVCFESMLSHSDASNIVALENAFKALKPGGKLWIYPSRGLLIENIQRAGFIKIRTDLNDVDVEFKACIVDDLTIAEKPRLKTTASTAKAQSIGSFLPAGYTGKKTQSKKKSRSKAKNKGGKKRK